MTYREEVLRLTKPGKTLKENLSISALGMAEEMVEALVEVHSPIKDRDKIAKELGDVLWYIVFTSIHFDITLNPYISTKISTDLMIQSEIGKFVGYVKKMFYNGHEVKDDVLKDCLIKIWNEFSDYVSSQGFTMGEIETANTKKMRERYKNSWNSQESIKRRDEEQK